MVKLKILIAVAAAATIAFTSLPAKTVSAAETNRVTIGRIYAKNENSEPVFYNLKFTKIYDIGDINEFENEVSGYRATYCDNGPISDKIIANIVADTTEQNRENDGAFQSEQKDKIGNTDKNTKSALTSVLWTTVLILSLLGGAVAMIFDRIKNRQGGNNNDKNDGN